MDEKIKTWPLRFLAKENPKIENRPNSNSDNSNSRKLELTFVSLTKIKIHPDNLNSGSCNSPPILSH